MYVLCRPVDRVVKILGKQKKKKKKIGVAIGYDSRVLNNPDPFVKKQKFRPFLFFSSFSILR